MGCINCPSERSEMNRREKLISLGVLLCFFTQQSFAANPLDDWHWQNPRPQGNSLLGIGFGQGRFIAVGTSGTIIQSTNSLDWAVIKNPTDQNLYGVGAGNGILVVVGAGGTVLTSTDGSNWTLRSVPSVTSDLKSVTYGNGQVPTGLTQRRGPPCLRLPTPQVQRDCKKRFPPHLRRVSTGLSIHNALF